MSDDDVTAGKLINDLLAMDDIDTNTKVSMFINLCDDNMLINNFKRQALICRMGMGTPDPIYAFAYGVLKLSKPYLFEEK